MNMESPKSQVVRTPTGWLATSLTFPRIGAAAGSEEAALKLLDERREWWWQRTEHLDRDPDQ